MKSPVRLAIMNDYEVVVTGLAQMLAPFSDRIRVVELDSQTPVISDVDVLLFDSFARERVTGPVEEALRQSEAKVVLYTWHLEDELVKDGVRKGVAGYLSKSLDAEGLVEAIELVAAGEVVVSEREEGEIDIAVGGWPGKDHGLSVREAEVLALIAQGLSNQEIADRAYLTINSIKSYIRSAYRKIGVERRTQAVLWATKNGFGPDTMRTFPAWNRRDDELTSSGQL